MSDLSWSTDVQHAAAGDRDAFARLMRTMEKEMYRLAWSLLHRDEDCADAIQETILKAYRNLPSLREPPYFRTWLFRILIRECQQTHRRRKRIIPFDNLPENGEVAAGPDLDLQAAVNRLREPLRTVVQLHYYADLPLNVIADMLNVSEGTLKSRLHRARRQLLKWLAIPDEGKMGYERR